MKSVSKSGAITSRPAPGAAESNGTAGTLHNVFTYKEMAGGLAPAPARVRRSHPLPCLTDRGNLRPDFEKIA